MKGYTLDDINRLAKKQRRRKNYLGWHEVFNAGNIPRNNQIFNQMSGAATAGTSPSLTGSCTGNPSSGGEASAASMVEDIQGRMTPAAEDLEDNLMRDRLEALKVGDSLTFKGSGVPDFPYLVVERNPKFPKLFVLYNKSDDGEIANVTKFSSLENALYWVSRCDEAIEMNNSKLNESVDLRDVELYYSDLPITVYTGGSSSGYFDVGFGNWLPDDGDEKEIEVDYTYEADASAVEECLADWYYEEHPDQEPDTDDEVWKFIEEHFDELVDRYMDKLLDHFEEDAAEEAQERDWSDYLYEEYHKENPYIFRNLQEAAEDKTELPGFWDDIENLPEEIEEELEDTDVELYQEDLDEPELESNPYDWDVDYMENDEADWKLVAQKDVFDAAGFLSEYTWYRSTKDPNKHIFMLDSDSPDEDQADHTCQSEAEARNWFNTYEGFPEDYSEFDDEGIWENLDQPEEDDFKADDDRHFHTTLNEGRMKDLDIDIQNEGSKEKLISRLEKDLAALESERSFLKDFAYREVNAGGAFDSKDEVDEALEAVEKDLKLTRSKLAVLRG